eukprot:TRINITY_DN7467_c0_g1_i2.p1 TRINITY_DN7467_c0_g1~~TRINITY_DN7467_c0_g1_i2.p1  ORF type:complete len:835 (+),score=123.75 TRINITY_DN7467_c0_g1_i2:461-2965(+)
MKFMPVDSYVLPSQCSSHDTLKGACTSAIIPPQGRNICVDDNQSSGNVLKDSISELAFGVSTPELGSRELSPLRRGTSETSGESSPGSLSPMDQEELDVSPADRTPADSSPFDRSTEVSPTGCCPATDKAPPLDCKRARLPPAFTGVCPSTIGSSERQQYVGNGSLEQSRRLVEGGRIQEPSRAQSKPGEFKIDSAQAGPCSLDLSTKTVSLAMEFATPEDWKTTTQTSLVSCTFPSETSEGEGGAQTEHFPPEPSSSPFFTSHTSAKEAIWLPAMRCSSYAASEPDFIHRSSAWGPEPTSPAMSSYSLFSDFSLDPWARTSSFATTASSSPFRQPMVASRSSPVSEDMAEAFEAVQKAESFDGKGKTSFQQWSSHPPFPSPPFVHLSSSESDVRLLADDIDLNQQPPYGRPGTQEEKATACQNEDMRLYRTISIVSSVPSAASETRATTMSVTGDSDNFLQFLRGNSDTRTISMGSLREEGEFWDRADGNERVENGSVSFRSVHSESSVWQNTSQLSSVVECSGNAKVKLSETGILDELLGSPKPKAMIGALAEENRVKREERESKTRPTSAMQSQRLANLGGRKAHDSSGAKRIWMDRWQQAEEPFGRQKREGEKTASEQVWRGSDAEEQLELELQKTTATADVAVSQKICDGQSRQEAESPELEEPRQERTDGTGIEQMGSSGLGLSDTNVGDRVVVAAPLLVPMNGVPPTLPFQELDAEGCIKGEAPGHVPTTPFLPPLFTSTPSSSQEAISSPSREAELESICMQATGITRDEAKDGGDEDEVAECSSQSARAERKAAQYEATTSESRSEDSQTYTHSQKPCSVICPSD